MDKGVNSDSIDNSSRNNIGSSRDNSSSSSNIGGSRSNNNSTSTNRQLLICTNSRYRYHTDSRSTADSCFTRRPQKC
ncbi:unnamed protein product [Closterium sp. NIES-54]